MAARAHLQDIVLTERERRIFQLLIDVVDHFGLGIQLRVAGGWVRDKLLGEHYNDIDIALDNNNNMTGQIFVQRVHDYLKLMGDEQKRVGAVRGWSAIFIMLIKNFRCLLNHFGLGTQLRVAGGWVRYKLLGKKCDNIDITLDNMTSQNFRQKVKEYSELMCEKQEEVRSKKKKRGGVIPCNPDKSKHLETAKMRIFGIDIDFVNLRSEKYAANSRIPNVENGTAEEDAFRRDLTINSLFYNINTKSVEDLTERGREDLKNGLIATPLPAKATFLDDPLRVLRAIRFDARFSFALAEDLKEAASDENVKSDLRSKISRERIRDEVDLMMSGNHPVNAMCYIRDLGLFNVVFVFPEKLDPLPLDKHDWLCVSHIEAAWNLAQLIGRSVFRGGSDSKSQDEQKRLCLYSALFTPVRNMVYMDENSEKFKQVLYQGCYIICRLLLLAILPRTLKFKTRDAKKIRDVHAASEKFAELILVLEPGVNLETVKEKLNDEYLEMPTNLIKRFLAGFVLHEIKELWRVALLISTLCYPQVASFSQDELQRRKEKYVRVERLITDLGLEEVWKVKVLLDGDDIKRVLQVPNCPLVGEWKRRVLKWQLVHPQGTKEECEEWVKQSQQQPIRQKVEM